MSHIIPEVERTSKLVQEISAASMEQNSGANQINNAINQLNQVTQQNAAAAEEMATSSEELSSQADQLRELISFFNVKHKEDHSKKNGSNGKSSHHKKTKIQHLAPFEKSKGGVHISLKGSDKKDSEFEQF
jgi:methyl-accepting chemotaxis protein